jgi:transcriptional regulator with XRE-family HTH domain
MENNLVKLIKERGISVEELTKETSVGKRSITEMMKGDTIPCISEVIALCDYFNCSLDYLFKRTDIKARINV